MIPDPINEQAKCVARIRAGERRTEEPLPEWVISECLDRHYWQLHCGERYICTFDGKPERGDELLAALNTRALPPEPESLVHFTAGLRDEPVAKLLAALESDKAKIRRQHADIAARNEGQLGMPQGPCQCPLCSETPAPTPTAEKQFAVTEQHLGWCVVLASDYRALRQQHAEEVASAKRERDADNEVLRTAIRIIRADRAAAQRERDEWKRRAELAEEALPLSSGKTRNQAREMLGPVLRHVTDERLQASHGCVEVTNAQAVVDQLIGEREVAQHDRAAALAAQAEQMQVLADIHDLATRRAWDLLTANKQLAAIAKRTRTHHTPV